MKLDEFIAENGTVITKRAGDHLFRQGEHDQSIYKVKSGLLKAYYLSADGKENIKSFIMPGDNIGSLVSAWAGKASTFSLVCLKPSIVSAVPFRKLDEASRADPGIAGEILDFLLAFGMKKEMREYELLCLTAEERYKRLRDTSPEIFTLVTQNEIARYLGITPVGLSRIKKRLAD
jgi:CRP-like cAMP-binding protein